MGPALANVQHPDGPVPLEYNDADYFREVLHLEDGLTEALLEDALVQDAKCLGVSIPAISAEEDQNVAYNSVRESAVTVASHHARTSSSGSQGSNSTGISSTSSHEPSDNAAGPQTKRRLIAKKSLSFSEYTKYIANTEAQDHALRGSVYPPIAPSPAPSLFSVSTRRSLKSFKRFKKDVQAKLRFRRSYASPPSVNSCVCCRNEFKKSKALHTLPCNHNYCEVCLRVLITQASNDESKMPPRCCTRPIPGTIIKSVLEKEEQQIFIKSVLQFSTPWEERVFCPNPACGDFIPKRSKIDPKHPFEVVCRKCRTRACSTCKRPAHGFGHDCPADWELDAVLQMGEKSGWRRCYKCRTLVELTQGCSHITCRCKAQFCYICGAVWDPVVGCPNYCNGEEELERRRLEEEARIAELEAENAAREEAERLEAAQKAEAEERTLQSRELNALRAQQINERERFCAFERKMRWIMWTRLGQAKLNILDQYDEMHAKMKERHARTAAHLEDRQVSAEMELRESHQQAERSVRIRLRHMEAYCDGLGRNASGSNPARVVTERDLRELDQQYNVRDDLERLHQSKINVMRDKQAKQMELLLVRQEDELEKLAARRGEELEALDESFANDEDGFTRVFHERQVRLRRRWGIIEEMLRKTLEMEQGVKFAAIAPVEWPQPGPSKHDDLEAVQE
ncbi:putative E3 ubiquitin-protein ligase [Lachnellula hyalina]|uniref:RBR-type E3 ubiquitin transferase n=1 Tax=Lachnellula hyalina TaxID=1316788 RepID=A0A8H8QW46_9HELO|nr:putative E3 ubiquitin-protein ligase [Lachnellula hyalina]TVY23908.1 putative E3 ubiquitin-protein ligase [Lachnellula hyalina]